MTEAWKAPSRCRTIRRHPSATGATCAAMVGKPGVSFPRSPRAASPVYRSVSLGLPDVFFAWMVERLVGEEAQGCYAESLLASVGAAACFVGHVAHGAHFVQLSASSGAAACSVGYGGLAEPLPASVAAAACSAGHVDSGEQCLQAVPSCAGLVGGYGCHEALACFVLDGGLHGQGPEEAVPSCAGLVGGYGCHEALACFALGGGFHAQGPEEADVREREGHRVAARGLQVTSGVDHGQGTPAPTYAPMLASCPYPSLPRIHLAPEASSGRFPPV